MKHISKLFALILVFVMVFSMGVSAKSVYHDGLTMTGKPNSEYNYSTGKEKSYYQRATLTVNLTEDAKTAANAGELTYQIKTSQYCGNSRTFERTIDVVCYNGNTELRSGHYQVRDEDYIVAATTYDYNSGKFIVPAGTTKIVATVVNNIGSNQKMKIDLDFYLYSTYNASNYVTKNADDNTTNFPASFELFETYKPTNEVDENGNTKPPVGEGLTLTFTDMFATDNSRLSTANADAFYKAAILNNNNLHYWSQLAYHIIDTNGAYYDHHKGGFAGDFGATYTTDNQGNVTERKPGYYNDIIADFQGSTSYVIEREEDSAYSSGLRHATNSDDVFNDVTNTLAAQRNSLDWLVDLSPLEGSKFRSKHNFTTDGTSDGAAFTKNGEDIYYTFVANTARDNTCQFEYNGFIIMFYDFALRAVNSGETYTLTEDPSADPEVSSTKFVNDNNTKTTMQKTKSWSYTDSFTNTLSNSHTSTKSMTHGWNASLGFTYTYSPGSTGGHGVNINLSGGVMGQYSTSDAFSFTESKAETGSSTQTSSDTIDTELPPYTVGTITSTTTTATASTDYPCPIEVNYKVAIISIYGDYYDDGSAITDWYGHHTKVWTFGSDATDTEPEKDAMTDLKDRALKDNLGSSDPVNWDTIKIKSEPKTTLAHDLLTGEKLLQQLATNYTITYDKATASYKSIYTTNAAKVYPLHDLAKTKVTKLGNLLTTCDIIYATPGRNYDISGNVTVNGYNTKGVEYYGFDASKGYWEVKYFNDPTTKVPENVAKVVSDSNSGKSYLIIDKDYFTNNPDNKQLMLYYHIKDNFYKSYNSTEFVNDTDLSARAALAIIVEGSDKEIPVASQIYSDVKLGSYYHDAVGYLTAFGLMNGVAENLFDPDSPLTRAQFVTVLYRLSGEEAESDHSFTDVVKDSYYEDAVRWATENSIVKGVSATTFAPDEPITREQMATIFHRYAEHKDIDTTTAHNLDAFTDAGDISPYAVEAMTWANANGLIFGTTETTLEPQGTATRGQAATVFYRYCKNIIN